MPDKQPESKLFTGSSIDLQTFLAERERRIAADGWMVMTVAPYGMRINYSIGMHDRGLPELITLGLDPVLGYDLVNDVCQMLTNSKASASKATEAANPSSPALPLLGTNEVQPLGWHRPFALIPLDSKIASRVAIGAAQRSEFRANFVQIVYGDRSGRYPWDPLATSVFRNQQPLLTSVN